ncbi:hypothetical protein ACFWAR_27920 [Streptomyces sp. NPDC059917]|uniref:hypothetical protein n=1 Tax=Streptomyces sp. NPDC059917 TaxID=3347002 RepID=UPI00364BB016
MNIAGFVNDQKFDWETSDQVALRVARLDSHRHDSEISQIGSRIDELDPTLRPIFEIPAIPAAHAPHVKDDKGVKDAAKVLDDMLAYLSKNADAHESAIGNFRDVISKRRTIVADYEAAVSEAVSHGEDAPDYPELDEKALADAHRSLNKLETVIPMAAEKAAEAASKLLSEVSRLRATQGYRKWAEKEAEARNTAALECLAGLRIALAERDEILDSLPDAFSDFDGVPFEPIQERNSLGFGGLDPHGGNPASLRESLASVEAAMTPGDGIRPWMSSQLSEEAQGGYSSRAALAKIDPHAARKAEEEASLADAMQYRIQGI